MPACNSGDRTPPLPPLPTIPDGIYDVTELIRAAAIADGPPPSLPPIPTVLGGERVEDVRVRGRHWPAPCVTVQAGDECISIRIDDDQLAEQWIEVTFSAEQVAELLARILIMRPMVEAGALQVLRTLSEHLPR
jgi:hypothetical protein